MNLACLKCGIATCILYRVNSWYYDSKMWLPYFTFGVTIYCTGTNLWSFRSDSISSNPLRKPRHRPFIQYAISSKHLCTSKPFPPAPLPAHQPIHSTQIMPSSKPVRVQVTIEKKKPPFAFFDALPAEFRAHCRSTLVRKNPKLVQLSWLNLKYSTPLSSSERRKQ